MGARNRGREGRSWPGPPDSCERKGSTVSRCGQAGVSRRVFLGVALAVAWGGSQADELFRQKPVNTAAYWNQEVLKCVQGMSSDRHYGPPQASRSMAIVNTCMYDAWSAYDDKAVGVHFNTAGEARRPAAERTQANKERALSHAAAVCMADQFPKDASQARSALYGLGFGWDSDKPGSPAAIGRAAAKAVLAYRHVDGANQFGKEPGTQPEYEDDPADPPYADYSNYQSVNSVRDLADPNHWQPLYAGGRQVFVTPFWERVKTFGLASGYQIDPAIAPPHPYPSQGYMDQVETALKRSRELSDEDKAVAEYWADGPNSVTPPGHWGVMALWLANRDKQGLDDSVKMFFTLSNSLLDAGVACWRSKRRFDYVRPITAVRYAMKGKTVLAWAGPNTEWDPKTGFARPIAAEYFTTYNPADAVESPDGRKPERSPSPPFAEYTSGHSTFSRAGAEALQAFTCKPDFGYTGSLGKGESKVEPHFAPFKDWRWTFKTFNAAAEHAGNSRLISNLHFDDAHNVGGLQGRFAAYATMKRALKLFGGGDATAVPQCQQAELARLQTDIEGVLRARNIGYDFAKFEAELR